MIEEIEDDNLKRDGNNVVHDLYINFLDAALGGSMEVPTIEGKVRIKIDPEHKVGKSSDLEVKVSKTSTAMEKEINSIHVNVWTPKKE